MSASRNDSLRRRDLDFATRSYKERKTDREIKNRIGRMAKHHRLRARSLIRKFYLASDIEIMRWLECDRKKPYGSFGECESARKKTGALQAHSFICGWGEHYHFGRKQKTDSQLTEEVRAVKDLIAYRRELLREAS